MKTPSPLSLGLACLLVACGDSVQEASEVGSSEAEATTEGLFESTEGEGGSSSTGSDATTDLGSTGQGTSGPPSEDPIPWQSECIVGGFDVSFFDETVACAAIDVPLDWDAPQGEQITITAFRLPSLTAQRRGTIWALDGGPGGTGLPFLQDTVWSLGFRATGWDIVIPGHRGSISPRLDCMNSFGSAACRAELEETWVEGLQHFNTLQAARDVLEMIRRERGDSDEAAALFGVSYGTYWAQFVDMQQPGVVDAIVLDSVLPLDLDWASSEYEAHAMAEELLQRCVDDPSCGPRVGFSSGAEFYSAVLSAIDDGECGVGDVGAWEDTDFATVFGNVLNDNGGRNYVPLLAAMLAECNTDLTITVRQAASVLGRSGLGGPPSPIPLAPAIDTIPDPSSGGNPLPQVLQRSTATQAVVMATTMLDPDDDPNQAALDAERHLASLRFGETSAIVAAGFSGMPRVDFDDAHQASAPVFILQAQYDLQTPAAGADAAARQHSATFVTFPDSRHAVSFTGAGATLEDDACARDLAIRFVNNPDGPLDTACAAESPSIDVNLQRPDLQERSMNAFGTADPWTLLTGR